MDYKEFCRNYYLVTNVPVTLTEGGHAIYTAMEELLGYSSFDEWPMYPSGMNPEFAFTNPDIEYGRVDIEGTNLHIILGPVFSIPITSELTRRYMSDTIISREHEEAVQEALSSIPQLTHSQMARHMVFVCMCVNGKSITAEEVISLSRENGKIREIASSTTDQDENNGTDISFKETYAFEQEFYSKVACGNEAELTKFLAKKNIKSLEEPRLASTPLRHAKNHFVISASKLALNSAIPGGMSIDDAYQLMGLYVTECEKLQSIEGIANLELAMVMDVCRRIEERKIPDAVSYKTRCAVRYIRSHIGDKITLDDVAKATKRSPSYISRLFSSEMKMSIGEYISKCTMEKAETMLKFTEMSLSEISYELGFSSQSYFQNVFKRHYGVTPLEYRRKNTENQKISD